MRTDPSHKSVGAGPFLVLKDDVGIVVGDEVLESGVVSRDFALFEASGRDGVLADVRDVLFEDERSQFARTAATIATSARTTGEHGVQEKDGQADHEQQVTGHVAVDGWTDGESVQVHMRTDGRRSEECSRMGVQ